MDLDRNRKYSLEETINYMLTGEINGGRNMVDDIPIRNPYKPVEVDQK